MKRCEMSKKVTEPGMADVVITRIEAYLRQFYDVEAALQVVTDAASRHVAVNIVQAQIDYLSMQFTNLNYLLKDVIMPGNPGDIMFTGAKCDISGKFICVMKNILRLSDAGYDVSVLQYQAMKTQTYLMGIVNGHPII